MDLMKRLSFQNCQPAEVISQWYLDSSSKKKFLLCFVTRNKKNEKSKIIIKNLIALYVKGQKGGTEVPLI